MKTFLTFIFTMLSVAIYAQGTPGLAFTFVPDTNETEYQVARGTADTTHIEIPSTYNGLPVTAIAESGFMSFYELTSVTIPVGVTTIGGGAFRNTGLTSVTIPNSVTIIGHFAFRNTGLTSVTIPNSVITILLAPFENLETIHVEEGNTRFRSEGNNLIRNSDNLLINGTRNSVIPNGVTTIGHSAFYGCIGLDAVAIPNSVTTIEGRAFEECRNLTSVTIPISVTSIGDFVFSYCRGLTSVYIPISVTTMGSNVFFECTNLTIYAEAPSQPEEWHNNWNRLNFSGSLVPVVWGHTVSDADITETVNTTALMMNYPNPFNPQTTIQFEIGNGKLENVVINVYNVKGQHVRTLVNGVYGTGSHSIIWNGTDNYGRNVGSGIYFYCMIAGEYSSIRRMMLLK
jgi:hypothetical protein